MNSYTLIITSGMHFLDVDAGETVLSALANGHKLVTVDIDWVGDGFVRRNVTLNTTHIVALIPNEADEVLDAIPYGPNVRALRRAR